MEPVQFLNVICRGLVGHVSYLATCSLSTVYSEYLLYEPIARIAQAKGYVVRCEVPVVSGKKGPGDHRRFDFLLKKDELAIGLEVKWLQKGGSRDVTKDIQKLRDAEVHYRYLLVFGRGSIVENATMKADGEPLSWQSKTVRWDARKTDYAARWLRVTS